MNTENKSIRNEAADTSSGQCPAAGGRHKVTRALCLMLAGMLLAAGTWTLYSSRYDSLKEQKLKRELAQMHMQYELISKKMDQVETVLGELQQRDSSIYRAIFETGPVATASDLYRSNSLARYQELEGFDNTMLMKHLTERINLLTREVYTQSVSYDEIMDKARNMGSLWAATPAIQPLAAKDVKYISSGFGSRMHPIYKIMRFHYGLDMSSHVGAEVYATADGKVSETDIKGRTANGLKITLDHGNGYETVYAHLSRVIVREGQTVKRGQVIGLVGNTGVSSGPHLHYEVHKNGKAVNPVNYFFNDLSPEEYAEVAEDATMAQSFD